MNKIIFTILAIIALFLLPGFSNSQSRFIIAVVNFQNSTGDPSLDYMSSAIPEIFVTNLAQSSNLVIVDRKQIQKIIDEQDLIQVGITASESKKIAKLLSARHLLSGVIFKSGQEVRIDVRLTEVSSGQIILAEKRRCHTMDEIIDSIDFLSENIITKITGSEFHITPHQGKSTVYNIENQYLKTEIKPQNSYYLSGSIDPFYIQIQLSASSKTAKIKKRPLNVCVVLDTSASMSQGGKMEYAKQALSYLIDRLGPEDIFSLVCYNGKAEVLIKPTQPVSKQKIKSVIQSIEPIGNTNIYDGLETGFQCLSRNYHLSRINRILLISDGITNTGVTDPGKIMNLIKTKQGMGISVSSFGLGAYFNEKFLIAIAEKGHSNYYFINHPDQIPAAFRNEFSALSSVSVQNLALKINTESQGTFFFLTGYDNQQAGKSAIQVKLGDLVSEERRIILFKFIPSRSISPEMSFRITLSFSNPDKERNVIVQEKELKIYRTTDKNQLAQYLNPDISREMEIFASSDRMEEALNLVDEGHIEQAQIKIEDTLDKVKLILNKYNSRDMKKQTINIIKYKSGIDKLKKSPQIKHDESFYEFQKQSRSDQYQFRKRK